MDARPLVVAEIEDIAIIICGQTHSERKCRDFRTGGECLDPDTLLVFICMCPQNEVSFILTHPEFRKVHSLRLSHHRKSRPRSAWRGARRHCGACCDPQRKLRCWTRTAPNSHCQRSTLLRLCSASQGEVGRLVRTGSVSHGTWCPELRNHRTVQKQG